MTSARMDAEGFCGFVDTVDELPAGVLGHFEVLDLSSTDSVPQVRSHAGDRMACTSGLVWPLPPRAYSLLGSLQGLVPSISGERGIPMFFSRSTKWGLPIQQIQEAP